MAQSKFGGIPVEDEQQPVSKFGGQPAGSAPAAPAPKSVAMLNSEAAQRPDPYHLRTPILADPNRDDLGVKAARMILGPPAASMHTLGRGMNGLAHPSSQPISDTAADIIEGGAGVSLPFAAPAMLARPALAAVGLGAGAVGRGLGSAAATMAGASPGASRLIGDVAGAGSGGAVSVGASRLSPAGVRGAISGGWEAAKEVPLIGKILRIPEGMASGYRAATEPRPVFGPWPLPPAPPTPPTPFREKYGVPRRSGPAPLFEPDYSPAPPRVVAAPRRFDPLAPPAPAPDHPPTPTPPTPFREKYGVPKRNTKAPIFEPNYSPAPPRPSRPEPREFEAPAPPPTPPAPKPPTPFSEKYGVPKRNTKAPIFEPDYSPAPSSRPVGGPPGKAGLPTKGGPRRIEIQHLGDPNINGRTPAESPYTPGDFLGTSQYGRPLRPKR